MSAAANSSVGASISTAHPAPRRGPSAVPTFEQAENLIDIIEINRARDALAGEIDHIDGELSTIVQSQAQVHRSLKFIEDLPEKLDPLVAESTKLEGTLSSTAVLAGKLSTRVKDLDKLREKVLTAIRKTNDIIELKNCIEGVQSAMSREDYDLAASHINRYLHFDKSILDSASMELLETAERSLVSILKTKLAQAIAADDAEQILRFCRLYPLLGMTKEGIDKYAEHLVKTAQQDEALIYAERDRSLRQADKRGGTEKVSYAAAVTQLLARVQLRIKKQRLTLENAFGRVGYATVLLRIQEKIQEMSLKLVEAFENEWKIQTIVDILGRPGKGGKGSLTGSLTLAAGLGAGAELIKDPREIAPMLDQLVVISQSLEVNLRFLKAVMQTPANKIEPTERPEVAKEREKEQAEIGALVVKLEKSYRQSKLSLRVLEFLGFYVRLEQFYMDETIKPALTEDSIGAAVEDAVTSPYVDDVFFVLKESCKRATLTYNSNSLCAVLNNVIIFLTGSLIDVLAANSKEPTSVRQTLKRQLSLPQILVGLNNLELSCDNIMRLQSDVDALVAKFFATSPTDLQKVRAILDEVAQTDRKYRHILQGNMELLATSWLPKVTPSLERFGQVNYLLSEQEFSLAEVNDPFMLQCIGDLDQALALYKNTFTSTNFDAFLQTIARHLAEYFEVAIFTKKFNQFGAMQLDRDMRNFVAYFTTRSARGIRDKFARVNQITHILNEAELLEHVGDKSGNAISWRLTPTEMKKVLALRTEFSREKIAKLRL